MLILLNKKNFVALKINQQNPGTENSSNNECYQQSHFTEEETGLRGKPSHRALAFTAEIQVRASPMEKAGSSLLYGMSKY